MKEKLILYGFETWQVEKLITYGKLETGHGIYRLKKDLLILQQGDRAKEIEL